MVSQRPGVPPPEPEVPEPPGALATNTAWPKRPTYTGRAPSTGVALGRLRAGRVDHETRKGDGLKHIHPMITHPVMISSFIHVLIDICVFFSFLF